MGKSWRMSRDLPISRIFSIVVLILACVLSFALTVPSIANNILSPGLISYFNADEGGLMDEAWFYYSGVKRDSFQWDIDYGLEMVYLSDLARLVPSNIMTFTPGTFVLILRWVHLLSWIGALIALWLLVGRHFGRGWGQALAVMLLAVRPAFPYFMSNLKPEPFVLLLMIIGLNYTLRIVESPVWRNILIAVACAAAALTIKFFGLFLLPAIVGAVYIGDVYRSGRGRRLAPAIFEIKHSWIFPIVLAIPLIVAPFLAIFCYVRHSNGLTLYRELGLLRSISLYKVTCLIWLVAVILIALSIIMFILNRSKRPFIVRVMQRVNRINSYSLVIGVLFAAFVALFGAKWLSMPYHFINTYVFTGLDFAGGGSMEEAHSVIMLAILFLKGVWEKVIAFDPVIFVCLLAYIVNEALSFMAGSEVERGSRYKRLVLLIFLLPFFATIFTLGRFSCHHMLPFFASASILAVQGAEMLRRCGKRYLFALVCMLLLIDASFYGVYMIKSRLHEFRQHEDVVFSISRWWRENIPLSAKVIAEHYIKVYVPEEYDNVKRLHRHDEDRADKLQNLINEYKPQYLYFRQSPEKDDGIIDIVGAIPGIRLHLLKIFNAAGRTYQRGPGCKYFIYEVLY